MPTKLNPLKPEQSLDAAIDQPEDKSSETERLLSFLSDLARNASGEIDPLLASWHQAAARALTVKDPHPEEYTEGSDAEDAFDVYNLETSAAGRTYRLEVHQDTEFGDLGERVRAALPVMLQRMVEGQLQNFIRWARPERGKLRNRRQRGLPFPHRLPYVTPEPDTIEEQIREEAGIVEAAVFFALSSTDTTQHRKLVVDAYSTQSETTLGRAPTNSYNRTRSLIIRLNTYAMRRRGDLGNDEWAGVAAHEILHNLGWGHPDNQYTLAMPIEIYQACISGGHHLDETLDR